MSYGGRETALERLNQWFLVAFEFWFVWIYISAIIDISVTMLLWGRLKYHHYCR